MVESGGNLLPVFFLTANVAAAVEQNGGIMTGVGAGSKGERPFRATCD